MKAHRIHIAVLLALGLDASVALAQVVPRTAVIADGASNTLLVPDLSQLPGATSATNIETTSNVSAAVTQAKDGGSGEQKIAVGAVEVASGATGGSLTAVGTLGNSVVQSQTANASQRLSVGSIAFSQGTVAGSLRADGVSTAAIVQTNDGTSNFVQAIDVGSAIGAMALQQGSLVGRLDGKVTQHKGASGVTSSGDKQVLRVGVLDSQGGNLFNNSPTGETPASVTTNGSVSATISQTSEGRGSQSIEVASVRGTGGGAISTNGTLLGSVQQSADSGGIPSVQNIAVGSAESSSIGSATTNGSVNGTLSQVANGGNLGQTIQVGGVSVLSNGSVTTNGSVADVFQSASGSGANQVSQHQDVLVGMVIGASGGVLDTAAFVTSKLTQTSSVAGSRQSIVVGSIESTEGGRLSTKAQVSGDILQDASGASTNVEQTIAIGSIRGTNGGQVTTNVTSTGTLQQTASGSASGKQTMLLGSVQGR